MLNDDRRAAAPGQPARMAGACSAAGEAQSCSGRVPVRADAAPALGDAALARADDARPLVLLVGPTGSGKTAAALALAREMPVEVVSVDSAQVYRGMDLGTAKPSAEERAAVVHHLLDVEDPAVPYSAARFATDAQAAIAAARSRGAVPLLAGGTMLYARALVHGFDDLPSADAATRAAIEDDARRLGWPLLHARLAAIDPATAARLGPNDGQRIQRALEVWAVTGQPMSALHAAQPRRARPAHWISLEPADRGWLHERLAARFDAMLAAGLLDEVAGLRARGDLHVALPSIRSVGYRQAWAHLAGEIDRRTMVEQALAATRQLARRQLTWLRSMPERTVIACDAPDATARALDAIRRALHA